MKKIVVIPILILFVAAGMSFMVLPKEIVGVGVQAPKNAEVLFDGTRKMLDKKWEYREGPRFSAQMPIKWKIVDDPVNKGPAVNSNDPAAAGGLYGAADIVTKKELPTLPVE